MTHMYFSAEGRISYGHLGRTNSCVLSIFIYFNVAYVALVFVIYLYIRRVINVSMMMIMMMIIKRPQSGRGLESRDPNLKFMDPLITFERIELSTTNLAQFGTPLMDPAHRWRYTLQHSCWMVQGSSSWPLWVDATDLCCLRDLMMMMIGDGPSLRTDYKTTPKWTWPRSRHPISKFWESPNNFWTVHT